MKVHYEIYESKNDVDYDPVAWFVYYPEVVPRVGEVVTFHEILDEKFEDLRDQIESVDLEVWKVRHSHAEGDIDVIVYLCINPVR